MPIVRTYGCPDCGGHFDFLHMSRDEPSPAHCELCRAFMGEIEPELPSVNIGGSNIAKSVDQVYNHVEAMGQTNMNDGLRAGEVAGKSAMPNNEVTRVAASMGHEFWQGSNTQTFLADAKRGPRSGTGAGVIAAIQEKKLGLRSV